MTNSHAPLHRLVTQTEKDRTVTGTVTAQQTVPGDLKATVTQAAKDRTVTNAVAANLKAQVAQASAARTVTGTVTAEQGTAANLKGTVTQAEKDRTVTGTVIATQGTAANLKAEVTQAAKTIWDESKDYASAQTNTEIKAAPGASLYLYITDILISNGAVAGNITLLDGSGGSVKWELYPGINGGCMSNLVTPIKLSVNTALCITSTTVTTHTVTICGYTGA